MDRLACVDVAELPLQVLCRTRKDWRASPAAVVDHDSPNGVILCANEAAKKQGVLPGQRYGAAVGLCFGLRAAEVGAAELDATVAEIERLLQTFSPRVESSPAKLGRRGTFFVDASGLSYLEPSLDLWARRMVDALHALGFVARAAVGFTRLGVLAGARVGATLAGGVATLHAGRGGIEFRDRDVERAFVRQVQLARLDVDPKLRDRLARLGIVLVGQFADLPEAGVRARFGDDALELHRLANEKGFDPLRPAPLTETLERRLIFDMPVDDVTSLLFFLKQMLQELLDQLAARSAALAEFTLHLRVERAASDVTTTLTPAAPTLDLQLLLQLATLHFERAVQTAQNARRNAKSRQDGIEEFGVTAKGAPAAREQLQIYREHPTRDLAAANRALALVRSRFGDDAVRRATLRDGHLPEASFRLAPLADLAFPKPAAVLERRVIRRVYTTPIPLSPPVRHPHNDGWLVHDLKQGSVVKCDGPYLISGGWWVREVQREYSFVHTMSGEVLWVFFDRRKRGWYLHGRLE